MSRRRSYPRVPSPWRAIVIMLLVLAAVAVGVDVGLRSVTESRLSSAIGSELGLPAAPEVDLRGFPFILQCLRGRFDAAGVQVDDVTVQGLALDRVALDFRDVRGDCVALVTGGSDVVTAEQGAASVALSDEALSAYLEDLGTPVVVEFLGPGVEVSTTVEAGGEEAVASARGRIRLAGSSLAFDPESVEVDGSFGVPAAALSFEADLPELVPGITYREVTVDEGTATLTASLAGSRLEIG